MLNLTYLPRAILAAQLVASFGVSKIINGIVKNNVTISNPVQKVTVKIASYVLSSMLIEQTSDHIERATNEVAAWFERKKPDEPPPEVSKDD